MPPPADDKLSTSQSPRQQSSFSHARQARIPGRPPSGGFRKAGSVPTAANTATTLGRAFIATGVYGENNRLRTLGPCVGRHFVDPKVALLTGLPDSLNSATARIAKDHAQKIAGSLQ